MKSSRITFKNGGEYVGLVDGKQRRHGHGTFIDSGGSTYTGGWRRGKASGFGKKDYASGDSFSGYFQSGRDPDGDLQLA